MVRILFPSEPFDPRSVDAAFESERDAALMAGLEVALIDAGALEAGAVERAVRRIPGQPTLGVYRGWMLRAEVYAGLHAALAARGVTLLNSPDAYRHGHHLPEWYPLVTPLTPRTIWTTDAAHFDLPALLGRLEVFGGAPLILKDFVKSRKHEWLEACFIPSAADAAAVERVVRRFVELQGPDLVGGLVFRELLDLAPLATHSRSELPLSIEYRMFVLDGRPILTGQYWEEGDYTGESPPEEPFATIVRAIRSRFFTLDVARMRSGEWIVMELGDGQVSGLPPRLPVCDLYLALAALDSRDRP